LWLQHGLDALQSAVTAAHELKAPRLPDVYEKLRIVDIDFFEFDALPFVRLFYVSDRQFEFGGFA
jgi:hypothetical protein